MQYRPPFLYYWSLFHSSHHSQGFETLIFYVSVERNRHHLMNENAVWSLLEILVVLTFSHLVFRCSPFETELDSPTAICIWFFSRKLYATLILDDRKRYATHILDDYQEIWTIKPILWNCQYNWLWGCLPC